MLNRRGGLALLGAITALCATRSATGDQLTFRLSWVRGAGAESCPNAEQLASAVEARLGHEAFSEPALRHIEGAVTRADQAWRVQLRVMAADNAVLGSRQLEASGPNCASIADAASLAIALTIDPNALAERQETSTLAPPPAPLPPAPAAPPPLSPARQPDRPSFAERRAPAASAPIASFSGEVVPRALFAVGLLPEAGVSAELGAELSVGPAFGLSMSMAYLPEARTPDGQFGLSVAAGALGLCFRALERRRAVLKVCGELMAGTIQVVVYDPIPTNPGERPWLAPRLGPRFAYRLGERLWLELSSLTVIPLVREGFSIVGVERPVFQTSRLSLLSGFGLRVSIP